MKAMDAGISEAMEAIDASHSGLKKQNGWLLFYNRHRDASDREVGENSGHFQMRVLAEANYIQ